jgi:hypothetical protein
MSYSSTRFKVILYLIPNYQLKLLVTLPAYINLTQPEWCREKPTRD